MNKTLLIFRIATVAVIPGGSGNGIGHGDKGVKERCATGKPGK
jgi:hypothetical protein